MIARGVTNLVTVRVVTVVLVGVASAVIALGVPAIVPHLGNAGPVTFLFAIALTARAVGVRVFNDVAPLIRRYYWPVVLLVLALTVLQSELLATIDYKGLTTRGFAGFYYDDEIVYHRYAQAQAEGWRSGEPSVLDPGFDRRFNGFHLLQSGVYFLFGPVSILVRLLNALSGVWLAYVAASLSAYLFPGQRRVVAWAFWLVAVNPLILVWSISGLRDTQVALGGALFIWAVVRALEHPRPARIWLAVGSGGLLWVFFVRPASVIMVVAALISAVVLSRALGYMHSAREVRLYRRIALLGVIGLLAATLLFQDYWQQYFNPAAFETFAASVEDQANFSDLFFSSTPLNPVNMLFALLFSVMSPNPLVYLVIPVVVGLRDFLLPGLAWFLLLPYVVWGLYQSLRYVRVPRRSVILVALTAVALFMAAAPLRFALTSDVIRYRLAALPLLVVFAAYGIGSNRRSARAFAYLTYGVLGVGALSYVAFLYFPWEQVVARIFSGL